MTQEATKITVDGKTYWKQMCRVERGVELDTERGVAVVLGLSYGAASQSFQACFGESEGGLARAMRVYLDLRAYPKGWRGYALIEGPSAFNGYVRGLAPLEVDEGKPWTLDGALARVKP